MTRPRHLTFRVASGHAPPPRAPRARAEFMARYARVRAKFKGGDLNLPARTASRLLNKRVRGDGVLWLTIPRRQWRVVKTERHDLTGDHLAPMVHLRHKTGVPMTVLVVNCMSVSTGERHAEAIMRKALRLDATVILASECRDFWAPDLPGAGKYDWWQPGEPGSSESGTLVASKRGVARMSERECILGSKATAEGDGIDTRSIARARIALT